MALHSWNISVFGAVGMARTVRMREGSYVVGSAPDCEVIAQGEGLEMHHALLTLAGEQIRIEPLVPEAETLLGGDPLKEPREVRCPVSLQLGSVRLEIEFAGTLSEDGFAPDQTQRLVHPAYGRMRMPGPTTENTQRISPQVPAPPEPSEQQEPGLDGRTLAFQIPVAENFSANSVPVKLDYALEGEIARGGMGRIYAAQDPTLERHVAVKVSFSADEEARAQFCHEARVLAHLTHPNIVPVYHMGSDGEGRPFYAMKLVQGRTLREVLRQVAAGDPKAVEHFSRTRLLRIFRKICDGVAFAHARGFIHRDLKPENVMVGEFGEVLVMDWGLAKALSKHGAPVDAATSTVVIEGTPQYMSPEQASGEYETLDERSDIYALGGILYSLLTLRPPVEGRTVEEVLDKVKSGQTTRMLESMEALRLQPKGPIGMRKGIPDALRAVTQKAMARQKESRYATVLELARDLEAYQNGFATIAEEAGLARLALLFVKRHRITSFLLVILLVGASTFTVRLARSEKQAKASALDARRQAAIALANQVRAAENAERADVQAHLAAENEKIANEEREESRLAAAEVHIAAAEAAEQAFNAAAMRRALEGVPADLRDQQWRFLNRVRDASTHTFETSATSAPVAFQPHPTDPDGLFTLNWDRTVRLLNLSTGTIRQLLKIDNALGSFAVSPDAKQIAVLCSMPKVGNVPYPGSIDFWNLESAKKVAQIRVSRNPGPATLKFNGDGNYLLYQNGAAALAVFESATGRLCWDMQATGGLWADFRARTGYLGVQFSGKWAMQFKNGTGEIVVPAVRTLGPRGLSYDSTYRLCADPDWSRLFILGRDVCRKLENVEGKVEYEIRLPATAYKGAVLTYLPLRKLIATLSVVSDSAAVLQLWNEADGTPVRAVPLEMQRSVGPDWSLLFQPGQGAIPDRLLVARGRQIKVVALTEAKPEMTLGPVVRLPSPNFTFLDEPWKLLLQAARKRNAKGESVSICEFLDARSSPASLVRQQEVTANPYFLPSTSRDGKRVALWWRGEPVTKVFKVAGTELEEPSVVPLPKYLGQIQLSPDGSQIWAESAVFSVDSGAMLSNLDRRGITPLSDRIPARWVDPSHVVEVAVLSNLDRITGVDDRGRSLLLWDVESGTRIHQVIASDANALSVSPDGTRIAEGGADMKVRLRDAETFEVAQTLRVHQGPVTDVAWHPNRPILATCSEDLFVRIWDLTTMDLLQEYGTFASFPTRLSWSPDGTRLSVLLFTGELGLFTPPLSKPQ